MAGSYNGWNIEGVEVFAVTKLAHTPQPTVLVDWDQKVTEYKNFITSYSPSHSQALGVNMVNIVLFGGAGTG